MKHDIYLDHAATTPLDARVMAVMHEADRTLYGNPGSLHTPGRKAKEMLEKSRAEVARILGAKPSEIVFTGSGTESDNLAIIGAAHAYKAHGKHIIISAIEHKAVLESAEQLKREGFEISLAPVNTNGILDREAFKNLLRPDTILVSIMYANNEIGTIQPVREIASIIRDHRKKSNIAFPLFHTDACQAAGALPLDVNDLGVDLLTLNGSKIYGPKGIGCLYVRDGVKVEPQIVGGGQERGMRAGTENVSIIAGFAQALTIATELQQSENIRQKELRDYFITRIKKEISGAHLNGDASERLPNNVNFSFEGVEGEALLLMLDHAGVYAATGSACSSQDLSPSHVLLATLVPEELAHGSLRLTLGRKTTKEDVDIAVQEIAKAVAFLRKLSTMHV